MCTYVIMKNNVLSRLSYHDNGFVATDALGHMMYGYTLLVPVNQIKEPASAQEAKQGA